MLGLCGLSLVVASVGCSVVAVHGLLIAVAFSCAARALDVQASLVQHAGSVVLHTGLIAPLLVGSSRTMG